MNKFKIILTILISFFLVTTSVEASTKTYTRTKDKLLVPDDVIVTDNNIEDILETPAVSAKEKIYDFGEIYSDDQEEYLYQKLNNYIDNSNIDAVIVTTRDLKSKNIDKYAYDFYDYNDFKTEGLIFVIYLGSNDINIFMGNSGNKTSQVFSIYTDEKINQTLTYIYKDIKVGNYYNATENYIKIIDGFYKLNKKGNYRLNNEGRIVKIIPWFEVVLLAVTLTFIIIMLFVFKLTSKNKASYRLDDNINNATVTVNILKDDLIDTKIGREK